MRAGHGRGLVRHRTRPTGPLADARERGAVLIEFALVSIILVTLLAGTYDLGSAWRAGLGVTEGARAGARVGSSMGDDVNADRSLMTSAQAAMASSGLLDNVTRVVIFKSATVDGKIPASCKIMASSGACNIFTGNQFRNLTTTSPMDANGCLTGSQRQGWCPKNRNRVQLTAEYIGVWIQVQYDYEFRLLGTSRTIERTSVMRLEPA
jgi:Flp pilus assembly protein TadG